MDELIASQGICRTEFVFNFSGFHSFGMVARVNNGMRIMTGQLIEPPREYFMLVAEKELIAFERKERELRRQERRERVEQKFPNLLKELQS